jgi:hypothetical protein
MADETPGDPLARGLPSSVCAATVGRQSRCQEIVTDQGDCPAQRQCGVWRAITNLCHPSAASPKCTAPDAARLLLPPGSWRSHGTRCRWASVTRPGPAAAWCADLWASPLSSTNSTPLSVSPAYSEAVGPQRGEDSGEGQQKGRGVPTLRVGELHVDGRQLGLRQPGPQRLDLALTAIFERLS